MTRLARLVILFLPLSTPAIGQRVAPPPGFDAYVATVMRTFEVPGLSVAIVKNGQVVLSRGYGVRELGRPERVDGQTGFGIASNSKVVTATALALLVEEGKIAWDARVIDYLPWFALSDPFVTRELTVRDLLVHRSGLGLGAGDLLWWPPSTYTRREIAQRLRFIPLATSFRSAYAYDNVLYLIAGELIEAMSGMSWEQFIQTRILDRVGMPHSAPRHGAALNAANLATPHAPVAGRVRVVKPFISDNTNPAGGIVSGSDDMARWVIAQLDSGTVATGPRLYSAATARQIWREVTPTPIGGAVPGFEHLRPEFSGYALGLGTRDYRGRKLLQHTGGLPGYLSKVAMIPSERLGVVVLTNQESSAAFESIVYHVIDHYLGVKPLPDYLSLYQRRTREQVAELAELERRAQSARDTASRPSLPLSRYAGTYRDAWYGDVEIREDGGRLAIRFARTPVLVGDIEHWQHDSFVVRWRDRELRADAYLTFALTPDGQVDQARMIPVSPAVDFSFDWQDLLLKPVR